MLKNQLVSCLNIFKSLVILGLFAPMMTFAAADPIEGNWKFITPEGNTVSVIKLTQVGNELKGTILKPIPLAGEVLTENCTTCSGEKAGKPIIGMEIISNLKKNDKGEWIDGNLYDLKKDRQLKIKFKLRDDAKTLDARGYLGSPMMGKDMFWVRE